VQELKTSLNDRRASTCLTGGGKASTFRARPFYVPGSNHLGVKRLGYGETSNTVPEPPTHFVRVLPLGCAQKIAVGVEDQVRDGKVPIGRVEESEHNFKYPRTCLLARWLQSEDAAVQRLTGLEERLICVGIRRPPSAIHDCAAPSLPPLLNLLLRNNLCRVPPLDMGSPLTAVTNFE
jgi:hypothetical protein